MKTIEHLVIAKRTERKSKFIFTLNRKIKSSIGMPTIGHPFIDEDEKMTMVKYKHIRIIDDKNHEYRLDGRSIRFMKRVKVLEN